MAGPLRAAMILRVATAALAAGLAFVIPELAFIVLLGSELIERVLFFKAVSAPKMPGNFGPQAIAHS